MTAFAKHSVRFRVTLLATLIVAVVLTTVSIVIVLVQQATLTAALDDSLRLRAGDLASTIAVSLPETLAGSDDDTAAQLTTHTGDVLVASSNLGGLAPIGPVPTAGEVIADRSIAVPDASFRVLSRFVPSPQGTVILHVAAATDDVSDSVGALWVSMLVAIPVTVTLLAATVWWMVGRALRPVEEMRREVDAITESDLSRRVPVPVAKDEVGRLAVTMNSMLGRVEPGVERLQRFVADASHELRSPLTRMRTELEVDMADQAAADMAATHASVLQEAIAMERLVGDMLFLARSDAGRQDSRFEAVDLDDLLLEVAERLRAETDLDVDVADVSAGRVVGDRAQLRRVVENLARNAGAYARSSVRLSLGEVDDVTVMSFDDDGPGIAAADRDRVFDRFTRTDEGRSRDDGGSGLGLPIVRDIVGRHGGTIGIEGSSEGGARFVVSLPRR